MKFTIKVQILFFIAGCLLFSSAIAQNSDAEYLKLTKKYTLHEDGRMVYQEIKDIKLLTHYAFNRSYGETFVVFNPEKQALLIDEAYTIMADGTKVKTPENAFNAVLPSDAADFPYAAHLREMVITHTALEVGSTIHLDYTLRTDAGYFPALMDDICIPANDPINEMEVIISVPEGTPFNYHVSYLRTGPAITTEDGFTVYTFTFLSVKPLTREPWQMAHNSGYPHLSFSTSKDFHRMVDWFVNQPAFRYETTPEITSTAKMAVEDAKTELEKITAIQDVVTNQLHKFSLNEEFMGYRVRTAAEVWRSNGGTQLERAIVLTTMLRSAGINAKTVALFAPGTLDQKAGNLKQITGYLVEVNPREEKRIYLSPEHNNSYNALYDYPNYNIMILDAAAESLQITEVTGPTLLREMKMDIAFAPEMSTISGEINTAGKGVPTFTAQNDTTSAIRLVQGISVETSDILSYNAVSTGVTMKFKTEKSSLVEDNAGYYMYELPILNGDFVNGYPYELATNRIEDIDLRYGIDMRYTYTVSVADGFSVVIPGEDIVMKTDFGSVAITYAKTNTGVTVTRTFSISKPTLKQQEYKELKTMVDTWRIAKYRQVIIKTDK